MNVLTIKEVDDETTEYFVNGESIYITNHDEHGWAGMQSVYDALTTFAKATGVKIVEV